MRTFNLLVLAFALLQAVRYGRGALLFLLPTRRVSGEAGVPPRSPRRLRLGAELEELGFVGLGVLRERAALGLLDAEIDVYAHLGQRAFADVVEGAGHEGAPGLLFMTPFPDGAAVITADHRRGPAAGPRLQVGSLPGASPRALLAAHEVAVRRFAAVHGAPRVNLDLEARLELACAWARGPGRSELRRAHVVPFGVVLISTVLLLSAVKILLRGAR